MNTQLDILNRVRSLDNKTVLLAIEELRARSMLADGALSGATLCYAQLQDADLMSADLRSVDFHQAHLEYANLSGANLHQAKLTRTNLHGANLDQADLSEADFYKTNLRRVLNLTDKQLSTAKRLWGSIMPDGEPYDGRYRLAGDLELAQWANVDIYDPEAMAKFYGVSVETYQAHNSSVEVA
ncbi:MAG: pentapeptide repeat-containing protein [Anaerolineae bacterium]|nr:pentapeptide repeat-containing protein [Anaerolineae bacterium]MBL6965459.1 pentapeptide repeat-containing protein [Anaerolineales bacterium]